ncbi:MAG: class I SAM-dependent rRNA methyltransferase [Bacteroidales bacterium]|nr:class I SAM-dependent rRNA methyltransferase [Bacteroidales bacterium]
MVKVFLKHGRDESLRRFHPWVFSGAVAQVQGNPAEGEIVGVYSAEGQFLASGHWQVGSIAVRILSFDADPTAPDFWVNSIARALEVRKAVGLYSTGDAPASGPDDAGASQTTCFRLVHGEGDGLPGLIIDWYDGVCVMQAHSVGMFRAKMQICEALRTVFGDRLKAVYDKSSGTAPFKAGLDLVDGYLWRAEGFTASEAVVYENGRKFLVNWEEGQKTGFFLDQRDNRALVGKYAAGRRVLNLFCYTGGFSIYALTAGAAQVDSVDSSAKAMSLVERNIALNSASLPGSSPHQPSGDAGPLPLPSEAGPSLLRSRGWLRAGEGTAASASQIAVGSAGGPDRDSDYPAIPLEGAQGVKEENSQKLCSNFCEDAIEFLKKIPEGKYDLMIVDPPAFAKHRGALKNALRAYQRLNAAAIAKVAPGGLVFTFSCSQVVDKITFANTVFSAAAQTGRSVRILDRLCQGADHPVSIYHPEGEYLKGLLLYVE